MSSHTSPRPSPTGVVTPSSTENMFMSETLLCLYAIFKWIHYISDMITDAVTVLDSPIRLDIELDLHARIMDASWTSAIDDTVRLDSRLFVDDTKYETDRSNLRRAAPRVLRLLRDLNTDMAMLYGKYMSQLSSNVEQKDGRLWTEDTLERLRLRRTSQIEERLRIGVTILSDLLNPPASLYKDLSFWHPFIMLQIDKAVSHISIFLIGHDDAAAWDDKGAPDAARDSDSDTSEFSRYFGESDESDGPQYSVNMTAQTTVTTDTNFESGASPSVVPSDAATVQPPIETLSKRLDDAHDEHDDFYITTKERWTDWWSSIAAEQDETRLTCSSGIGNESHVGWLVDAPGQAARGPPSDVSFEWGSAYGHGSKYSARVEQ